MRRRKEETGVGRGERVFWSDSSEVWRSCAEREEVKRKGSGLSLAFAKTIRTGSGLDCVGVGGG